jgi:hypothetical protein
MALGIPLERARLGQLPRNFDLFPLFLRLPEVPWLLLSGYSVHCCTGPLRYYCMMYPGD